MAAHKHTVAEIIFERANADCENMGLTSWDGKQIKRTDVEIAKNYLNSEEIDALNKEPGIHSARYLGHDTDYTYKNTVILERMKGVTNRSARFVSAIALAIPNQETKIFTGIFEGEIHTCIAGGNGFGYDPIFYVPECGCTSAELSPEAKNAISHRGKALEQVLAYLKEAGL